jgi:carboxyl-terminal processing protease
VLKAIYAKLTDSYAVLADYALELKPRVTSTSITVQPAWREELYKRLTTAGVTIDRKQWDQSPAAVDRMLRDRLAKVAYGDSTVKRLSITAGEDRQLDRAAELLRRATSQQDLFAQAARTQSTASRQP